MLTNARHCRVPNTGPVILVVLAAAGVTYQRAIAGPSPVVSDVPLLGTPTAAARLTPSAPLPVAQGQGDGSLFVQALPQVTVKYGAWKPDFGSVGLSRAPINVWVVTLTGLSNVPGPAGSALRSAPRTPEHNIAFIVDDTGEKMLEAIAW